MADDQEVYDGVGGDAPFHELVEHFYEHVAEALELRKLYPDDLEPGKKHLAWFLIQRFGGPAYFNDKRGAPMLRRRHMPFEIDFAVRDLWLSCMMDAVDATPVFSPYRDLLHRYFDDAATFLVNRTPPASGIEGLRKI